MAKRKYDVHGRTTLNLTTKEFNFCNLVLSGKEPHDAALEVGYKECKSFRTVVWRLMNNPRIVAYINAERTRLEAVRRQEVEVDDIWIIKKFREILDRCMQARPVMRFDHEIGELVQARDEESGDLLFQFDAMGAIKAAENLAKHIGFYEKDNNQKRTVIKIGAVQNVQNFFFEDEQPPPQEENPPLEIS